MDFLFDEGKYRLAFSSYVEGSRKHPWPSITLGSLGSLLTSWKYSGQKTSSAWRRHVITCKIALISGLTIKLQRLPSISLTRQKPAFEGSYVNIEEIKWNTINIKA